ncbi:MAG: gliding motility-associated C-terminal domain-containing protein, partial [Marinirhabdus sp.]
PANNAFNGTNTFTNSSVLYNMDIDFYSIENGINPGDTSIAVNLTSSQDFVMVNNVVTVINNQLPDATITIDNIEGGTECGNLDIVVDYTVFNEISTEVLPANTPIAFYVETTPVGTAQTQNPVPIGGMESGTATLTIPDVFDGTFTLLAVVDDDGNGNSTVAEQNENNNTFGVELELMNIPNIPEPPNLETCDVLGTERFDLTEATQGIAPALEVTFYLTEEGANNGQGPIADVTDYLPGENPQTIFIRVENGTCFNTGSFTVQVIFCPLPDAAVSLPLDLAVCPGSDLEVEYTIHNTVNARGPLPAGTPVTIYIKNEPQLTVFTQTTLPVNSSGTGTAVLVLPDNLPIPFNLRAVADNDSAGNGTVAEFDESNNGFSVIVGTAPAPKIAALPDLLLCDTGFEKATFNLTQQLQIIDPQPDEVVQFFTSFSGAASNQGPIAAAALYENSSNPQPIFVRVENGFCFGVAEFNIATARCPITIPQGFSPNGDTVNDTFNIEGLTDIFLNFHLEIYSRNGNLIYEGGHKEGLWDGVPNKGLLVTEGKLVPTGTYYYALNLNDFDYPGPFTGWVYVNY